MKSSNILIQILALCSLISLHTTHAETTMKSAPVSSAESTIAQFLDPDTSKNPHTNFHFHGWRWHTMSVIRDSNRLQQLADQILVQNHPSSENKNFNEEKTSNDDHQLLSKAVDHVVDFNLKGLQRIEDTVFFPWLREKLAVTLTDAKQSSDSDQDGVSLKQAFGEVIDGIESERQRIVQIADDMRKQAQVIASGKSDEIAVNKATSQLSQMSESLSSLAKSIFDTETKLLVPAVAKLVPYKEQNSVNKKILMKLGILESRAILVGMSETLNDEKYGNEAERALFQTEIPFIPRKMLPLWKSTVYESQAGMLEQL